VQLAAVCENHRLFRDYTHRELRDGLREMIAAFPVYRPYSYPGRPVSAPDRHHIAAALESAKRCRPDIDGELLQFVADLLTLGYPGPEESAFAVRFAQLSAPIMAKGVEDTAFYRYFPLSSLNEVGGDPGALGEPVTDFHRLMVKGRPDTLLTLSTHDTKRSADVRARINVLSELPGAWEDAVNRWAAANDGFKRHGWPDRNAEYLLYQTLLGAWPIDAGRTASYMEKASREAKVHTSWVDPDQDYDTALRDFVAEVMADEGFVSDITAFLAEHHLVERGRINALAQTTLLLTCPGVADIYQGTEIWDLSLVDPDNRRAVDYEARRFLLAHLSGSAPEVALEHAGEGGPKLWLIHRLLQHRRRAPGCYGPAAAYEPLPVRGTRSKQALAFTRRGQLAVVIPRLSGEKPGAVVGLPAGNWRDVLTDEKLAGGDVAVDDLLRRFPVAVLERQD
jgi:(1->4)-alpha-D-glucan 1-alpha-D-glucosylmutase